MPEKPTYLQLERQVRELSAQNDGLRREIAKFIELEERHQQNIARQKRTEKALRQSEEKYRGIFENVSDLIFFHDLEGNLAETNFGFVKDYGYNEADIVDKNIGDFIAQEYRDQLDDYLQRIREHGQDSGLMTVVTRDGRKRVVEYRNFLLHDDSGAVGVRGSARDITDRVKAEAALRESEAQYRAIVSAFEGYIYVCTKDYRIGFMNERFKEHLGRDAVGDLCYEAIHGRQDACPWCVNERVFNGETVRWEVQDPKSQRWLYIVNTPIYHSDGSLSKQVMTSDITERKNAEEALRQEKKKFQVLVEESPLGVSLIGEGGDYIYVNPKFSEIFGYTREDIPTGRYWFRQAFPDPEYRHGVISAWIEDKRLSADEEARSRIFEVRCKDDALKTIHFSSVTLEKYQIVIYEDITQTKQLEAQLLQAQKMEAIGVLAGGIAHDFNNILAAIMGYVELARLETDRHGGAKRKLDNAINAGRRAQDLIKQILTFSRKNEHEKNAFQLSTVIEEALGLLGNSLPATIEIRRDIGVHPGKIWGNPIQIQQVLFNLCTNAFHAMGTDGGVLKVALATVELDSYRAASHPDLTPGPFFQLSVSDTGSGIDPADMKQIFDPYFTTKEKGVGTGLGLSMVQGIVQHHNGAIRVRSTPGKDTRFDVFLPRIEMATAVEQEPSEEFPRGDERILFVDDETALVEVAEEMLEWLGYQVVTQTSSARALEVFKAEPDKFDLVITDQTMPGMAGDRLAREMIAIRPDIPIILCTGFSEIISENQAKEMGIRAFMMKPIGMRRVADTIRATLDAG